MLIVLIFHALAINTNKILINRTIIVEIVKYIKKYIPHMNIGYLVGIDGWVMCYN